MEINVIFRENVNEPIKKHVMNVDSIIISDEGIFIRNADGYNKTYDQYHSFIQLKAVKNTGD